MLTEVTDQQKKSYADFGCDPGEWTDAWSASGMSHHWSLGAGDLTAELRATAELIGAGITEVGPPFTRMI